eukprot:gene13292-biopygen15569
MQATLVAHRERLWASGRDPEERAGLRRTTGRGGSGRARPATVSLHQNVSCIPAPEYQFHPCTRITAPGCQFGSDAGQAYVSTIPAPECQFHSCTIMSALSLHKNVSFFLHQGETPADASRTRPTRWILKKRTRP